MRGQVHNQNVNLSPSFFAVSEIASENLNHETMAAKYSRQARCETCERNKARNTYAFFDGKGCYPL